MRIGTVLAALFLATTIFAQSGLRKEVEAFYAKWDHYVNTGQLEKAIAMIDVTFHQVGGNGTKTNYWQTVNLMRNMKGEFRLGRSIVTVDSVQRQGDEVVAWVTNKVSAEVRNGKKWKKVNFTGKYAETLKRFPGGWKFVYSQELP